jgi:hypothetical protein
MMDEEARPPLIVPLPVPLTESDEERPKSAQIPVTSNAVNDDSDRPAVSAISATEAMEAAYCFKRNDDPEPDEASNSSIHSAYTRRKRK